MDTTRSLPSGTVTFLFTDMEGSTKLWDEHPEAMRVALARHDAILRRAIESHGGHVFKTIGDEFCAAFATAPEALTAALAAQQALQTEPWGTPGLLRVRMALHTGAAQERDGDYFGPPLNRVARLLEAAHGGQTLLSLATEELVRESVPDQASLRDLGVHRLKDLQQPEHIFQLHHPTLPADFPPLRSPDTLPNNLPQQVTSFIGREKEMAEVKQLLGRTRLLTLTGAGGTGKTRLAFQVAADLLQEYPEGVWLVELAPLSDPALVPQTVASVLGVREEPGNPLTRTLVEALKRQRLLLLLDNCEHVLGDCATLADAVLRSCPDVSLLATSREGLNIPGETPYRLRSLSVPDPRQLPPTRESLAQFEAVHLFLDRATTVAPSFTVTPQNAPAVAQVCSRLDGIPLAIELAAARVKVLSVEQIAARLDDRFRLLTGGSRTALPRQQSLRALIDWSHDLLSEPERTLLRRLSVFAGGWTLEAAEAVCGDGGIGCRVLGIGDRSTGEPRLGRAADSVGGRAPGTPGAAPTPNTQHPIPTVEVLDLLTSLVDKSLVVVEEQHGGVRYRLLEMVRQYARDRMLESGEVERVRGRHRDWFLSLAEEIQPQLSGGEGGVWFEPLEQAARAGRLETEHDNLRVALEWSLSPESEAETALRLAGALGWFWQARGYWSEGQERLSAALARSGSVSAAVRAKALRRAGQLAGDLGDDGAARRFLEESLAISRELGDQPGIAQSLDHLGWVLHSRGDHATARSLLEECLRINRELGRRAAAAMTLGHLGYVARGQGDYAAARSLFEEHLAIERELGNKTGIAWALNSTGWSAQAHGEYALSRSLFEESLAMHRELGNRLGIAVLLSNLGQLALLLASFAEARLLFAESLTTYCELGRKRSIVELLEAFARLEAAQGQPGRAVRLLGKGEDLREGIGFLMNPRTGAHHGPVIAAARAALGEESFAAVWAEGRSMTLEQAVAYALKQPGADTATH